MIMLGIMTKSQAASLLLIFFASGCSSTLTKPGQHVEIAAQAPSPTRYLDVGEIVAAEPYYFAGDEDDCKDLIRDYAGRGGADVVVIKSKNREPCETDTKTTCVAMRAEAYRIL